MVCSQCGAGMTPEMVKSGACGFCGTAVEGVAHAHMEEHVEHRVRKAEEVLRRELKEELKDELEDRGPSAITVAAAEAGRYTAAKVWGCGAGCLSTVGSLIMLVIIVSLSAAPALYEAWLNDKAQRPGVEQPQPKVQPKPAPLPVKKKRPRKKR
jgi:hypothetical protein